MIQPSELLALAEQTRALARESFKDCHRLNRSLDNLKRQNELAKALQAEAEEILERARRIKPALQGSARF
jgi:hypothetical protein